jgi:hypothetical protein
MSRKIPFFDESVKLDTDIELAYIDNPYSSPDTRGVTQVVKIHNRLTINDKIWYEVSLLTDSNGRRLNSSERILIQDVVSIRKHRNIKNRKLYHLSDEIIASRFINNDLNKRNSLEAASRSSLGSGVYGLNLPNIQQARDVSTDNKNIYEIDMLKAFDIQDKEHGESITIASLLTNRFLDRVLSGINFEESEVLNSNIENLVILWNIVFYRNKQYISYNKLQDILSTYLNDYLTNHELTDKRDGKSLIAFPINYIMKEMGYTGLIADDLYNNGWDRGCVSYNFEKTDIIIEGKAFY